jgi:hypothetical protein
LPCSFNLFRRGITYFHPNPFGCQNKKIYMSISFTYSSAEGPIESGAG